MSDENLSLEQIIDNKIDSAIRKDAFVALCRGIGASKDLIDRLESIGIGTDVITGTDVFKISPIRQSIMETALILLGIDDEEVFAQNPGQYEQLLYNFYEDIKCINNTECDDLARQIWTAYAVV